MLSIPKISIGKADHRNKFDLSCVTHTTSEVGYMQPVFSKILSPKTTIKINTRSLVRLSSLFVPTMGKLDLRIYHAFVPLNTIWTPFDAFQTGTDYTLGDGSQYRPTKCPFFTLNTTLHSMARNEFLGDCVNALYVFSSTIWQTDGIAGRLAKYSELRESWFNESSGSYNPQYLFNQNVNPCNWYFKGVGNGFIIEDDRDGAQYPHAYCYYDASTQKVVIKGYQVGGEFKNVGDYFEGPIPELNTCDWSLALRGTNGGFTDYTSASLFSIKMRRLRKVFLGLGYSFNPYDKEEQTPFKLLAYYKAWYQLFYPQRDSNFYATNCYKLTKLMSENGFTNILNSEQSLRDLWIGFINDLADVRYILPLDYFSLADPLAEVRGVQTGSPVNNDNGSGYEIILSGQTCDNTEDQIGQYGEFATARAETGTLDDGGYYGDPSKALGSSALAMRTAMKLMRFINKNTVVGKKVSDILRMRFGVADEHERTHESVFLVGSSKVDIQISDVMSTAETEQMNLGDYAGKGVGYGESKYYTFDTGREFGVFVSFAAIVPITGYYQGMLRENSMGINDRFDFYSPEFDALGYDDVKYNELVADYQFGSSGMWHGTDLETPTGTNLGSIGYVPRYTHMKVSKDICNGDISLYSRRDSMLPYTLDRHFDPSLRYVNGRFTGLPDMTPENFRSLNVNDFNRIFNSQSTWDDHFIIQMMCDVTMWCNMRSLATSFDTLDDDGDSDTIDMNHQ